MVMLNIGGQDISFMVDTGAGRSVVNTQIATPTRQLIKIQGATGVEEVKPFLAPRWCNLGQKRVVHQFVFIPECPIPLLGRDLLSKMRAEISFDEDGNTRLKIPEEHAPETPLPKAQIMTVNIPMEEEWRLMSVVAPSQANEKWKQFGVPGIWAEDNPPGKAVSAIPIVVQVKPGATPVRINQRRYPWNIAMAIQKHLDRFLKYDVIVPIESPWNTRILPVPKGNGEYRPVQDLRVVNQATVTIHPVVPNPYVLLGLIPKEAKWFTVLDLKDAFFSIPIHQSSQPLFAFEWEDPRSGRKRQYAWKRLPQGFKNSPTLFGTALGKDLEEYPLDRAGKMLLQYVDDLLLTSRTEEENWEDTQELLELLLKKGYKVSRKKAQLVQTTVKYLGYELSQGQRSLGQERKEVICRIPRPKTRKNIREFLGTAGYCRIWIPNFGLLAKPLYDATKGGEKEPLEWGRDQEAAFNTLKRKLMEAPALGLPNLEKPFNLFIDQRKNVAVGVLTQAVGSWERPVAYLSKQLDQVAAGWPGCLKAIASAALLVQEANKLTFGQKLTIHTPHAITSVLDYKGHYWFTTSRMLKYQGLLTQNAQVEVKQSTNLNPATLIPDPEEAVAHDCIQTLDTVYASRPDLKDQPLPHAQYNLYTDGSSFMENGHRKSGYAFVTLTETIEAQALPGGTSAQLAELIALTRALQWSKDKIVNIFTDSKYAFLTLQAHGALYKERGLLTSGGKQIKHGEQILQLLDAVWEPKEVAVVHCRGHQKSNTVTARGNQKADEAAKGAARMSADSKAELCGPVVILNELEPVYTKEESQRAVSDLKAKKNQGWWVLPDNRPIIPESLAWTVVQHAHQGTHMGKTALASALLREVYINKVHPLTAQASRRCVACAQNNPRQGLTLPPGKQPEGDTPFASITIDFTDMPRSGAYSHLLVMVCNYSGWPECMATQTKKAREVVKALLREIIPRFGLPEVLSSDNGPEFTNKITQEVSRILRIDWKLHCAYHPQSSGRVERMNRSLKNKLSKICQETNLKWPQALPLALFAIRCSPRKTLNLSPFELMYGRPPHIVQRISADEAQIGVTETLKVIQGLGKVVETLQDYVIGQRSPTLVTRVHGFKPGDRVWVRDWKDTPLKPRWRGPFVVLLCSPLAIKVQEIRPWIHWTRVKPAADQEWQVQTDPQNPLRVTFKRTVPGADKA